MGLLAPAAPPPGRPRRRRRSAVPSDPMSTRLEDELYTERFLVRRPLLRAVTTSDRATAGAAHRRGRPGRRRVRGVPARDAWPTTPSPSPSWGRSRRRCRRSWSLTSNRTRDVHDALEASMPLPLGRSPRTSNARSPSCAGARRIGGRVARAAGRGDDRTLPRAGPLQAAGRRRDDRLGGRAVDPRDRATRLRRGTRPRSAPSSSTARTRSGCSTLGLANDGRRGDAACGGRLIRSATAPRFDPVTFVAAPAVRGTRGARSPRRSPTSTHSGSSASIGPTRCTGRAVPPSCVDPRTPARTTSASPSSSWASIPTSGPTTTPRLSDVGLRRRRDAADDQGPVRRRRRAGHRRSVGAGPRCCATATSPRCTPDELRRGVEPAGAVANRWFDAPGAAPGAVPTSHGQPRPPPYRPRRGADRWRAGQAVPPRHQRTHDADSS